MERRSFLKKAGTGLAAGALATPALTQAQTAGLPEIKWRMPTSYPKSLDTLFGSAEFIGKRVAEITDNKFQIRAFAAGELVLLEEYNCVIFPAGNTGTQMAGWYRKEIKSLADVKGLKFRIGGLAGMALAKIGVVPQQLAGPDIYPALEKGTIDATEWVGPADDEKLGFNKIAQYYYYPSFWEGGPMLAFLVNDKKWNELPKPYKAALEAACGEANVRMMADYDVKNPQALRRLVAGGTKLRPFPKAVLEAAEKAVYELYDELSAKSAHWKRIYPEWKKFRDEQFLWFRVAENTYDNYVFSSKVGSAPAKKK